MTTTPKLLSDAELKEIRETADRYSTSIVIALTDHIAALTAVPMDDEVTWAIRVLTNGSTLYDEDNRTIVGIITRLSSSLAKVTKERDEAERAANDYEASVDELHIKLAKANGELNDARAALEKMGSALRDHLAVVKALFEIDPETKKCWAELSPRESDECIRRFQALNDVGKRARALLPLKLLVDRETLKAQIAADPDIECEAGDIAALHPNSEGQNR